MVTIGKTFRCEEKVLGSFFIKFLAYVRSQWQPRDMEVSIFSLFDPISPLSALKTMGGPIPGVLGFNDVELTIEAKSHDVVSYVRACSVHDDWIKTVKAEDGQEVTRLNQVGIYFDLLCGSWFEYKVH